MACAIRSALAALLPTSPPPKTPSNTDGDNPADPNQDRDKPKAPYACRRPWAELLKRVFDLNVLVRPHCGGNMRNISHIEQPEMIASILGHLGLPTTAPDIAPARAPPQFDFDLDVDGDVDTQNTAPDHCA